MLRSVTRPDGKTVTFKYDALGRRKEKRFDGRIHRYLWDGNVVLHEWAYAETDSPQEIITEDGAVTFDRSEPADNVITWVYDTDSYVPTAKIENGKTYSIVSDYIGRPVQAYDECGTVVWQADYDIYGNLRNLRGDREFIPFRQLGQYEDAQTGLYYNRFRYYDPNIGNYISQDPIGLAGNNPTLYGYVRDINTCIDLLGLDIIEDAWKVVQSHMNDSGKTVLGHFPRLGETFESYIEKEQRVNSSYFDMGNSLWNKLIDAGKDPWELNKRFLDEIINKGDDVFLNVPKNGIRPNSYLEREIEHLQKNGYKWVNQWSLKKAISKMEIKNKIMKKYSFLAREGFIIANCNDDSITYKYPNSSKIMLNFMIDRDVLSLAISTEEILNNNKYNKYFDFFYVVKLLEPQLDFKDIHTDMYPNLLEKNIVTINNLFNKENEYSTISHLQRIIRDYNKIRWLDNK